MRLPIRSLLMVTDQRERDQLHSPPALTTSSDRNCPLYCVTLHTVHNTFGTTVTTTTTVHRGLPFVIPTHSWNASKEVSLSVTPYHLYFYMIPMAILCRYLFFQVGHPAVLFWPSFVDPPPNPTRMRYKKNAPAEPASKPQSSVKN